MVLSDGTWVCEGTDASCATGLSGLSSLLRLGMHEPRWGPRQDATKRSSPAQTISRGRQLASDWSKQTRFNMHVLPVLPAYVARHYIQ